MLALAMWLFRERTGLIGNAVGWPVLSLGLALLVLAGTATDSALGRLRVPGAAWLAAISYSVYLTHKAMFHVTQGWLGATLDGRGVLAFAVYGVVALAAVRCCITWWNVRSCSCAARCCGGAQPCAAMPNVRDAMVAENGERARVAAWRPPLQHLVSGNRSAQLLRPCSVDNEKPRSTRLFDASFDAR